MIATKVKHESKLKDKTKYKKIVEEFNNNVKISNYNLGNKFSEFEEANLSKSITLLYEITKKPKYFTRYSRGAIIRVRFGINIGSAFSGDHYAIVISKGDTMLNPILHVIPITSTDDKQNLKIDNFIYKQDEINKLIKLLNAEKDKCKKKRIKKCIKYYSNNKNRNSYACIKHINTISKLSILPPLNEYDYINNICISQDLLDIIDKAIIKEYTNITK